MFQHFLYSDDARYTRLYLSYAVVPDFLRHPVPVNWQRHYADADLLIGEMAEMFHKDGIPVFLMPGVFHDQAALVEAKINTPGVDPFAFNTALSKIASRHHMFFVDSLRPFVGIGPTNGLFYPFDSHPTARAQKLFASSLMTGLLDAGISTFRNCEASRPSELTEAHAR